MKAKFKCTRVTTFEGGSVEAVLQPVTGGSEENKSFSKYTPSGELKLTVTNENALGFYKPGKNYFLDIVEEQLEIVSE